MTDKLLEVENSSPECNGTVFRANVQMCRTARGIMFSVRLDKLKRKSCPGCEKCGWIDEELSQVDNDNPIIGIESCEHGELYTLTTCNHSTDWETGQVDGWDLKVVPYHEED